MQLHYEYSANIFSWKASLPLASKVQIDIQTS